MSTLTKYWQAQIDRIKPDSFENFIYSVPTIQFNPVTDHLAATSLQKEELKKLCYRYYFGFWPKIIYRKDLSQSALMEKCINPLLQDLYKSATYETNLFKVEVFVRNEELQLILTLNRIISNRFDLITAIFLVSLAYLTIYSTLQRKYYDLKTGLIYLQPKLSASCFTETNGANECKVPEILIPNFLDHNWELNLERTLLNLLENNEAVSTINS